MYFINLSPFFATFCIVGAGFLLMFRQKNWSVRLLLLALLFVIIGTMGPAWLPE